MRKRQSFRKILTQTNNTQRKQRIEEKITTLEEKLKMSVEFENYRKE